MIAHIRRLYEHLPISKMEETICSYAYYDMQKWYACYHPNVTPSWSADYDLQAHIQQFMQGLVILKTLFILHGLNKFQWLHSITNLHNCFFCLRMIVWVYVLYVIQPTGCQSLINLCCCVATFIKALVKLTLAAYGGHIEHVVWNLLQLLGNFLTPLSITWFRINKTRVFVLGWGALGMRPFRIGAAVGAVAEHSECRD